MIFHTGDFKIDFTPVFGSPIDLQRIGEIGKKGVLALCATAQTLNVPIYHVRKHGGKNFRQYIRRL